MPADAGARRRCVRRTYHSSPLEQAWLSAISRDSSKNAVCQRVRADQAHVKQLWLTLSAAWQNGSRTGDAWSREIFSRLVSEDACAPEEPAVTAPLEPLFGYLRHPLHACVKTWGVITDKQYLVLPLVAEVLRPRRHGVRRPRAFFFDLGASTYARGMGGSSMNWFVDAYRRHGIAFDEIHAWEAKWARNPMGGAPQAVREVTHFYNGVPVNATPGAPHNPLRLVAELTHESDFVVLKMDFDQPAMEDALLDQLLGSPRLVALIDELIYEQVALHNPLVAFGPWRKAVGPFPGQGVDAHGLAIKRDRSNAADATVVSLAESFALFHRLRNLGIRAHSWV